MYTHSFIPEDVERRQSFTTTMKNKLCYNRKKQKYKFCNDFILKYIQDNNHKIDDISLLEQRRFVFISLNGIYQSWRKCPSLIMYSAILIMPLKREWVYDPLEHDAELQMHFVSQLTLYKGIFIYTEQLNIRVLLCCL